MAKTISVSTDDVTYHTLPGSSGDLNHEASSADDTTFGAAYSSSQSTIVGWSASANAFYKGLAGYQAVFHKTGTSTAMVAEATTELTGTTFQVTDSAKRVLDRTVTITANASISGDVTADISAVDHLFGIVTFSTDLSGETVTISGNYLPLSAVGTAREFSLTMNAEAVDTTDFATAQSNGGYSTFTPGIKTVSIDASGFYNSSNGFRDLVTGRSELIVSINPDGSSKSIARGYFKAITTGQSGDVGGNEDETITFELSVPQSDSDVTKNVVTPFKWSHTNDTTLHTSVQNILTQWQDGNTIYVKYLHDGTNGYKGEAVITDCSLSTSIDGVNEFSVSFQGDGATTAVP